MKKGIFAIIVLALFLSCEKENAVFFPPELGELKVTEITDSSAMVSCNIMKTSEMQMQECGFCYYPKEDSSVVCCIKAPIQKAFSANISGLMPEKEYMVKAYAKNVVGTSYSNLISFETLQNNDTIPSNNDNDTIPSSNLPIVQTFDATNIGTSNATLNGYVWSASNNSITATGFVYGTNSSNLTQNVSCGIGAGNLSKTITGLTANTTYYYKAYATNSVGTAYGDVKQFRTTTINAPTVYTISATNITAYSATLNGIITSDGGTTVTARGFVYGTSSNNLSSNVQCGSGMSNFNKSIMGLSPLTTYYYKAYATNSVGTIYGELLEFTTNIAITGTLNGHDWVDLGLPSGTRWATCNVGANTPVEYGDYFAWGETEPKETYNWSTYRYCNGSASTLTKYCYYPTFGNDGFVDSLLTLEASDDAATVNWGQGWRMPSWTEIDELINNCTRLWTSRNGVNGCIFTGPNGNSIFLPAAGYRSGGYNNIGYSGLYWSRSLYSGNSNNARYLAFSSGSSSSSNYYRYSGFSVRPVCNHR